MPTKPPPDLHKNRYLHQAMRPVHMLVFVAPLLAMFHIRLIGLNTSELLAHRHIGEVLNFFGATGWFLPGLAVVAVLLGQQVVGRHRWRIRPLVPVMMVAESIAWMLPLVALAHLAGRLVASQPVDESIFTTLSLSIGAGIYEEFLFRQVLIGVALLIFVDVFDLPKQTVAIVAMGVAAIAFSLYHPDVWSGREMFSGQLLWTSAVFKAVAGLYLGAVFLLRGYGIVVGAHALYNIYVAFWGA
ncbi:hypothetical protein LCGC14_0366760 [marine sediment metagenome]|uniref:CAAX prenyl protease 2/Lysostaphin resistance protein A-like domain-containing protein n=1 Tax=marine sediment metagenome TaxID=412755 RepID=A0A0F9TCD6_9ZZZZ|nr:CPBP family intramembrane metalloprotease [Phycisphaerae bacterium]HDZ43215.1 CPBP family intramembrane metalloprotease [Phycisphaerae bacterium]